MRLLSKLLLVLGLIFPASVQADVSDKIWQQVKTGEVFVLIRHALAPGTGDPSNFNVKDCSTQRNLNSEGRFQSQKMGEIFKDNGLGDEPIYSSQWCRCLDTAKEMGMGEVIEHPMINSFFRNMQKRDEQTQQTQVWLKSRIGKEPSILVSHQVNITALTDIFPSSGELIFAQFNEQGVIEVIGRLETR